MVATMTRHKTDVVSVDVGHGGTRILTEGAGANGLESDDVELRLWDANGGLIAEFPAGGRFVSARALSPDKKEIAICGHAAPNSDLEAWRTVARNMPSMAIAVMSDAWRTRTRAPNSSAFLTTARYGSGKPEGWRNRLRSLQIRRGFPTRRHTARPGSRTLRSTPPEGS